MAPFRLFLHIPIALGSILLLSNPGHTQSLSPFRIQKLSTESSPQGVSVTGTSNNNLNTQPAYAVVANTGSNSVSVFPLGSGCNIPTCSGGQPPIVASSSTVVPGIAGPYAVATCTNGTDARAVITSPADHSISVLKLPDITLAGKVQLAATDYSAACYWDGASYKAVASTSDNVLNVVDLSSLSVTQRFSNIPAARSLHGVGLAYSPGTSGPSAPWVAYVAGIDANVVTGVRLSDGVIERVFSVAQRNCGPLS